MMFPSPEPPYSLNEGADTILESLEGLGMLPPSTNYFVDNFPEKMLWSEVADYHRWEPEDDGDIK